MDFIFQKALFGITAIISIPIIYLLLNLILRIIRFVYLKSQLTDFPVHHSSHWLWGHMSKFVDVYVFLELTKNLAAEYETVHQFPIPLEPVVRLVHPDYVKCVANTNEPKAPTYKLLKNWIGEGIISASGAKWKRNRRLLTPAFHFDSLKSYLYFFCKSANGLIENWQGRLNKEGDYLEMFEEISLMTLDSLLKCIFTYPTSIMSRSSDLTPKGRKGVEYIRNIGRVVRTFLYRFRTPILLNELIYGLSYQGYQFRSICAALHEFTDELIAERRVQRAASSAKVKSSDCNANGVASSVLHKPDFLDILLDARDEDGKGLSEQEIREEVASFVFAGHDTTSCSLSWLMYNLALHPEYQDQCRSEAKEVLAGRDSFDWEDLSQLNILTRCLKESLRIFPPVPNISRSLERDITLPDGRILPKGVMATIGIHAMHHNPAVWPDPERFDPSRFDADNLVGRNTHAFMPFSAGPRNCIGQHFALAETKAVAALLLQHFRFETDPTRVPVPYPEIVLRTRDGLWLRVTPLNE